MSKRKLISIVTPCYNEEENVRELCCQIRHVMGTVLPEYDYEHIFIDNGSTDTTVALIKEESRVDKNVKGIVNSRNFGHIRSPFYGLVQANGDAVMLMVSDLQDPPSLIPEFVKKWEEGNEIVIGVKKGSEETPLMFVIRKAYYYLIEQLSEIKLRKNYTGFGLYDKKIINILKDIKDPYPYFRGLVLELGYSVAEILYTQPKRVRGITKNNFFTLYDMAMLGICSHSKVPLRIATLTGFILAFISFLVSIGYLIAKLVLWDSFAMGMAPVVLGIFFFASVQLFFLGILGEYIGVIYTKITNRPLVFEKERINF
ncbi:MAG: glycosyltransferase family 2 protein [Bacteriovoracaceae bacterium]